MIEKFVVFPLNVRIIAALTVDGLIETVSQPGVYPGISGPALFKIATCLRRHLFAPFYTNPLVFGTHNLIRAKNRTLGLQQLLNWHILGAAPAPR